MFGPGSPFASGIVHRSIEVQIRCRLCNLQYSKYVVKHKRRTITNATQMITTEAKKEKISPGNDLEHGRIKRKWKKERNVEECYIWLTSPARSYTGLKNRAATNRTQGD